MAGRKGKVWYVAGINSENTGKEVEITLPFIESGAYQMSLIGDGADAKSFSNKVQTYQSNQSLKINLLPYGGFVAIVTIR